MMYQVVKFVRIYIIDLPKNFPSCNKSLQDIQVSFFTGKNLNNIANSLIVSKLLKSVHNLQSPSLITMIS